MSLRPTPSWNRSESIRRRAEELYVQSGRLAGRDLENWAQAEQEVDWDLAVSSAVLGLDTTQAEAHATAPVVPSRKAIVLRISGKEYVGEYDPESSDGYRAGEFAPGIAVPIRLLGNVMLVVRPNGKVLKTTII